MRQLNLDPEQVFHDLCNTWHEYASETRIDKDGKEKRFRLKYNGDGAYQVETVTWGVHGTMRDTVYLGWALEVACQVFMGIYEA
jgi:hypothetical protein